MMKRLFRIILKTVIGIMMISDSVLAMTFSQPIEIGRIFLPPMGYFEISGAKEHIGKPFTNQEFVKSYRIDEQIRKGTQIYDKGVARFGDGEDAIYFHYDAKNGKPIYNENTGYNTVSRFGDKDINNSQPVGIAIPTIINIIHTDTKLRMYLLIDEDPSGLSGTTHTVLGKREDGKFVVYFDTAKIKRTFFSIPREFHFSRCRVESDTIIIQYMELRSRREIGEFRFKWDDAAQWFGVEQVGY